MLIEYVLCSNIGLVVFGQSLPCSSRGFINFMVDLGGFKLSRMEEALAYDDLFG